MGDMGKVERGEMCKPRNWNIILRHLQAFKEDEAGRWERPELLCAMQLCRGQGEQVGQPREQTRHATRPGGRNGMSQDTEALGMTLLQGSLGLGFSVYQMDSG